MSVPDYPLEETLDFKFTTRSFTTGAPTTLSGTPVVQVYEDNSITQITAGITLTVDFDGLTGLNNLRIVATAANGYGSGQSYQAVISTGTVGGVSVVGEVVQQFSINRSPALRSTVAGRALDITVTGAAGIDWNNIENPTTIQDLSATNIDTDQVVASVTGAVGSVTGSVGSVASGGITAASIATDAIDADAIAVDAIGSSELATSAVNEIRDAILSDSTAFAGANIDATVSSRSSHSAADAADAVWDELRAGHVTAGTFGQGVASVQGSVTGSVGSIAASGITSSSFAAGAIDAAAINSDAKTIERNTAFSDLEFLMVLTSDHVTPATGLIVTGQRSIDGGTFGGVSGAIAEVSNGIYQFDALAADTNGSVITYRFSSATADDTFITITTEA